MKKLRLDTESLSVETFEVVSPDVAARGTVHGHNDSWAPCGHTPDGACANPSMECTYTSCIFTVGCKTAADCVAPTLASCETQLPA